MSKVETTILVRFAANINTSPVKMEMELERISTSEEDSDNSDVKKEVYQLNNMPPLAVLASWIERINVRMLIANVV